LKRSSTCHQEILKGFFMMGIGRLIRSLISWALILGAMGILDEAVHQLAQKASKPRILSLSKLNRALVGETR